MTTLRIKAGPYEFEAQTEDLAPNTSVKFLGILPYRQQIIHVRWSGEGCWIPLGEFDFGLGYENHTSHPAPGDIILYPGGISETEILLGLRRGFVFQQGRPARRQSFPDHHQRPREPHRAREDDVVEGRAGYFVRAEEMTFCRVGKGAKRRAHVASQQLTKCPAIDALTSQVVRFSSRSHLQTAQAIC